MADNRIVQVGSFQFDAYSRRRYSLLNLLIAKDCAWSRGERETKSQNERLNKTDEKLLAGQQQANPDDFLRSTTWQLHNYCHPLRINFGCSIMGVMPFRNEESAGGNFHYNMR
jgi:hypothetical protein